MIDRRGMRLPWKEGLDDAVADRYKFDHEDDDDEIPTYQVDPYDIPNMRYRARISGLHQSYQAQAAKRQQIEASASQNGISQQPRPSIPRQTAPD